MTVTKTLCDHCGAEIDLARPALYLASKRRAPSIDADLCSIPCVIGFAVRLHPPAGQESAHGASGVTE